MLFGKERKIRQAAGRNNTVFIREIECKGDIYCRVRKNFEDSFNIHVPFETLCKVYDIDPIKDLVPFKIKERR